MLPGPSTTRDDDRSTSRALLAWFTSPRQAVLVLFGLHRFAPGTHLRLGVSPATGAEGDVVVASGRVPVQDQARVQRAFDAIDVAAMWGDPEGRGASGAGAEAR
jgi:hypothetical protein